MTPGWCDIDYITLDYIHFESSLHPYPAFLKHNWLLQGVTCPSWPDVLSSTIRFWIVVMSCGGARQTKMHGDEESCVLWCGTADRTAYHCILKCRVHQALSQIRDGVATTYLILVYYPIPEWHDWVLLV